MLLLLLHPDPAALAALPFPSLVVNVPLEFLHRNFAGVAGHVNPFAQGSHHRLGASCLPRFEETFYG